MNRRIQSIGSVQFIQYNERKKNPFDPITHPVTFFRTNLDGVDPTLNQKFINKSIQPAKVSKIYSNRDTKFERPSTGNEIRIEVPYIEKYDKNPLNSLKEQLFETIVKNRIYKESDIQELFKFTRQANSHLDESVVEHAISLIYKDLNS